jgi:O-antigen/teichoic acid export membrane protein
MKSWTKVALGVTLTIFAFASYLLFFVRFPITRDVPWVPFTLFVIAIVLMISGVRSATRKLAPSIVSGVAIAFIAFIAVFGFAFTRHIPSSRNAPAVGQRAPEFTARDTSGRRVALSQLLAAPGTRGVIVVFFRGYW